MWLVSAPVNSQGCADASAAPGRLNLNPGLKSITRNTNGASTFPNGMQIFLDIGSVRQNAARHAATPTRMAACGRERQLGGSTVEHRSRVTNTSHLLPVSVVTDTSRSMPLLRTFPGIPTGECPPGPARQTEGRRVLWQMWPNETKRDVAD